MARGGSKHRETVVKTNGFWVGYLIGQVDNNEPLHQLDSYPGLRDGLKTSDVQEVAKRYLSGDNYIRLVLLPEIK